MSFDKICWCTKYCTIPITINGIFYVPSHYGTYRNSDLRHGIAPNSHISIGLQCFFLPSSIAPIDSRVPAPKIDCWTPGPDDAFWRTHLYSHYSTSFSISWSIYSGYFSQHCSFSVQKHHSYIYSSASIRSSVICQTRGLASASGPILPSAWS